MKIEIRSLAKPAGWNEFDPPSAHPANTTHFANFYREFFTSPLFLEAVIDGEKAAQWLFFKIRSKRNPFKVEILTRCGPQVLKAYLPGYDNIFAEYIRHLKSFCSPVNISVFNFSLIRGVTKTALETSGFRKIEEYSAYINKIGTDEEIMAQFHSSHRNDTRKAIKENYLYKGQLSAEAYYELSRETYGRSDREGPQKNYLIKLEKVLAQRGGALISGVYAQGRLNAASVILFHGENAYYLHGASATEKARGATTYIHYENMRVLRGKGVLRYDVGGARIGGEDDEKSKSLSAFKERFGGRKVLNWGGEYH